MESNSSTAFYKDSELHSTESIATCSTILDDEESLNQSTIDTEIVIIGNGPAGLSLSAFLSGWKPYYNINKPHSDQKVHEKLSQNLDLSLLDQDLSWFEEEYAEIINPSIRPISHLIDMLMRPVNCLNFVYKPEKTIPHIVLGETDIGGSWTEYDDEMITVSLANWLELPGFTIEEWLQGSSLIARLPAGVVREYLKAYAVKMHLMDKIKPKTKVTIVTKHHDIMKNDEIFYTVSGEDNNGEKFLIRCKKVVIACGQSHQKHLEVYGEFMETNIAYDVAGLKKMLYVEEKQQQMKKIVVIGDGISAADAINFCLKNELPVVHVMRRSDTQLRQTMLSKLSDSIYPEYSKMYKLMTGKTKNHLYTRITSGFVTKLDNKVAQIQTPTGIIHEPFYILVACIGRRSELPMFPEKLNFNNDYHCDTDPNIFGIGSVVGDHFIRYLVGGCLLVASSLIVEHNHIIQQKQFQNIQNQMAEQLRQMQQKQKRLRRKPASGRCCWFSRILYTTS